MKIIIENLECPFCNGKTSYRKIVSFYSRQILVWTDGFSTVSQPYVVKCPNCGHCFIMDDVKKSERQKGLNKDEVNELQEPSLKELYHLINHRSNLTTQQEIRVRIQIWWYENNRFRSAHGNNLSLDEKFISNLQKLESLLNENIENERIMKIEINRELNNFEKAKSLFDYNFSRRSKLIINLLKDLIERKVNTLQLVTKK